MVAIAGIYQNGEVKLNEEYVANKPVKVIVTFLEEDKPEPKQRLTFDSFSFAESRKALENFKGSLSNAVIEERRSGV